MLSLLAPFFLAGLAALAVPVLVHLVQRQDPHGIGFPSLMFLRRIPYEERRKRRIRDWLLLLLRCLALALLALAFSRPFLPTAANSIQAGPVQRDIFIVVDRSYSMAYADHWQRAQQAAGEAIAALGAGDRAALLLFDSGAELASGLSSDKNALQSAIANASPSAKTTDLALALDQAGRLLRDSEAAHKEILLISDFQRSSLDPEAVLQLPHGIVVTPVPVRSERYENAAVSSVILAQPDIGKPLQSRVLLHQYGERPVPLEVKLDIDGRASKTATADAQTGMAQAVSFAIPPALDGLSRISFTLPQDNLNLDNYFYLVLSPPPVLSALIVENRQSGPAQSFYLRNALALSELPAIKVETVAIDELTEAHLERAGLVILNNVAIPGAQTGERLRNLIEAQARGLLVIGGDHVQGGWPGGASGYLPGTIGRRISFEGGQYQTIAEAVWDHPVWQPLKAAGASLAGARIKRYRQLAPDADTADQVLARYADGAPALVERRSGSGRVMVLTTTLDNAWNDIVLQPAFAPWLQQAALYLAGFSKPETFFQVGDIVDLAHHARASGLDAGLVNKLGSADEALIVEAPDGQAMRIGARAAGRTLVSVDQAGFYEVHTASDNQSILEFAVNIDTRESDLAPLDIDAMTAAIGVETQSAAQESTEQQQGLSLMQRERSQQLWWYLLIAAFVFLIAETALSNRLSRKITHEARIS